MAESVSPVRLQSHEAPAEMFCQEQTEPDIQTPLLLQRFSMHPNMTLVQVLSMLRTAKA